MLRLLLMLISYGSFLLLLVPPISTVFLSIAIMLIIGAGLLVYKKAHKVVLQKNKWYLCVFVALLATIMGISFYKRWIASSKYQAIAALLHMPPALMLGMLSLILAGLSSYFLLVLFQMLADRLSDPNPRNDFSKSLLSCLCTCVVTVILSQVMAGTYALSMGCFNFLWCVLIVSVPILLLYCLSGKIILSNLLGAGVFMVLSTINAYVYIFRSRLFEPVDVFSAGTAMNVAENYHLFPIPSRILFGWGVFTALMIALYCLQHKSHTKLTAKRRCILLAACAIATTAIAVYATGLKTQHWLQDGAKNNGYFLDFVSKFKEIKAAKPQNYSTDDIAALAGQYADDSETESSKRPHIIVIMDEAFSDLSVLGELETNTEVIPFISSLKENTISGYALSSVYGGNTANSEYEFLTGNSLAWLSPNVVPYQQYLRSSTYSMVSYLKSAYDYRCIAMHPYLSSGWNRPAAYENLGFDECHFIEDFPQQDYIRNYISDREMFEFLIETFESQKENPLFLLGVTMQNHGSYTYSGENFNPGISLNAPAGDYPDAEQYLSLIHETDKAVEYLISYFQSVDEEVVIVFFGDHQPKLDESFYAAVSKTAADTLDEQQKRYEVPFFIWTNYDIEERTLNCTSLNYLSTYVYETAGLELPVYNRFLSEMEETIPAINANGFYSLSAGCYLPFEEASEAEQKWLEWYEMLQYNCIFDTKHRNETFFPTLE